MEHSAARWNERVRNDVTHTEMLRQQSREWLHELQERCASTYINPATATDEVRATLVAAPDWESRAAAVMALTQSPELATALVADCYRTALDDPDGRVRGVACLVLARCSSNPELRRLLQGPLEQSLVDRFGVPAAHPLLATAAEVWLETIVSVVDASELRLLIAGEKKRRGMQQQAN